MTHFPLKALLVVSIFAITPATHAAAQFEAQGEQSFRAADTDGNELLTLVEFRTFIRLMANAGAPMSQRIVNFAAYRVAFARVDVDGNGVATPEELRAAEQAN